MSLGSGLVEIAALTVFIGSTAIESLAVGSKGASGMPWEAMSTFGSVFMIKACVAAATPSWLRDSIGVRNARSDGVVGMSLNLIRKFKSMQTVADAVGIQVHSSAKRLKNKAAADVKGSPSTEIPEYLNSCSRRKCTPLILTLPELYIHVLRRQRMILQYSRMFIYVTPAGDPAPGTVINVIETCFLRSRGAKSLAIAAVVPWAFCASALVLELMGISREDIHLDPETDYVDILAEQIPINYTPGKDGKILLDMAVNPRRGRAWRVIWAVGSIIASASLVATYVFIGKEKQHNIYSWGAFQFLWLICRSVFFHLATETDDVMHMVSMAVSMAAQSHRPPYYKDRLLALVSALSRYQVLVHPKSSMKGPWCYAEDIQAIPRIKDALEEAGWKLQPFTLNISAGLVTVGQDITIEITGIIGDTMLSSVAWDHGCDLTLMDLYDSILFQIKINSAVRLIPSARALARARGRGKNALDLEASSASRVERGRTNDGTYITWAIWIPLQETLWLHFCTEVEDIGLKGKRTLTAMSREEVTSRLMSDDLGISLTSVCDVEEVIEHAIAAGQVLCKALEPHMLS